MTQAATEVGAATGFAWMPIGALAPWDENPRYNDEAVPAVAESIRRFGFVAPIVVWTEEERMVAGHTRLRALESILEVDPGFVPKGAPEGTSPGEAPVRWQTFESEAEADAYALADNRLNELADWNDDQLAEILAGLGDDAMAGLGWATTELEALVNPASLDDVKWKTFDETIGEGADKGKQVTCPECDHKFRV